MHMPHLSKCQAVVLALYSFGILMTRRCGQTTVALFLGGLLGQKPSTLRQRLREWTYEAAAKKGATRCELVTATCFAPLLRWVLHGWTSPQVVLALDMTYLGERWMVLSVSVLYRASAIPVAWCVLRSGSVQPWHPLWVTLLKSLRAAVPSALPVYVLTDRGLASKRLFRLLCRQRWVPLMRIRAQGKYKRQRQRVWCDLEQLAQRGQSRWCHRVTVFKGDPFCATLLVTWVAGYEEPCLVLTTLPPHQVNEHLYALRMWIEAGFKALKRGALHWEQSKMDDPSRVERVWLAMSVALIALATVEAAPPLAPWTHDPLLAKVSWVTRGWLAHLLSALLHYPLQRCALTPYEQHFFATAQKTYP